MIRFRSLTLLLIAGLSLQASSLDAKGPKRPPEGPLITIHAPHPERLEFALDEIGLDWGGHPGASERVPAQSVALVAGTRLLATEGGTLALVGFPRVARPEDLSPIATALEAANPGAEAHLVLYVPSHPKSKASRGLLTRQVGLILEQGADPGSVTAGLAVVSIRRASVSGGYVLDAENPLAALSLADLLRQRSGVKIAYPMVRRFVFHR